MLLISGCSFVDNSDFPAVAFGRGVFDNNYVLHLGRGGAGNFYISQSIIDNLHRATKVFVLWSGLHRIDVSIPKHLRADLKTYDHAHETQNELWFHTGGFSGTWHSHKQHRYPDWLHQYIKAQYKGMDWQFLNHRSLSVIACCLSVLESKKIPYAFGFIYDIHQDYSDIHSSLGTPVDVHDPVYNMIPWDKCLRHTPYEFCREKGLLQDDGFHPTREGYIQWWKSVKDQVPFGLFD